MDKAKNLPDIFFDGDLVKSVAVGSYVEMKKGFLTLIGKVDGEHSEPDGSKKTDRANNGLFQRELEVSLVGFINNRGMFTGGTSELPLIGNQAFVPTRDRIQKIHNLLKQEGDLSITIGETAYEKYKIELPIDGLMNSHIAIFGNTGSGKSNTLAHLYQAFIKRMQTENSDHFTKRCRVIIFDFNGEYSRDDCLTTKKSIYNLSTRNDNGRKIPLDVDSLLNLEMISILADATEKTQKPFLRRSIGLYHKIFQSEDPVCYLRNTLTLQVQQILQMADKDRAFLLLDYLSQILRSDEKGNGEQALTDDLEWHNKSEGFMLKSNNNIFFHSKPDHIEQTKAFHAASSFTPANDILSTLIIICYVQLIYDVLSNRAQNEHIAPVINKLKSKQADIEKIFDPNSEDSLFDKNVVIISLNDVNLEMKKTIPLLVCRKIYQDQKSNVDQGSLSIVIDEAHNILSTESSREAESWKSYRLETFEEIIKEGRKFGTFVTIASQRPSDISPTITSQAHNYFIHRLINEGDLRAISKAVSYIDKLTEESIPVLPVGTCIFSGVATQMPMKLKIWLLPDSNRPKSSTLSFADLLKAD
ncbi:hypothetical protein SAR116_1749 [Candidatus Puniceispirillum marinum IMCC1322]|uniref:AAA+ ATPase domain-containing protein n=2 Tax=Candidatus Puniceispirillum TaxID=767891 RepID=D5BME9_PUNMI|nr:hypothetical protein SAR116_1749 [Candidatus Puniceispirillum marinum IMCC1322]